MSILPTGNAASIQTDFLNLLVAQLQNQNPLEPMDSSQMTTQLAQISELQELENLNSGFAKILASQQMSQAAAMVGKEVLFLPKGSEVALYGEVNSVDLLDNKVVLQVGQYKVPVESVQSIR